jgi:hypothetical protein
MCEWPVLEVAFVSPSSHTQFPRLNHGPKFLTIVCYCSQSIRNRLRVFGTTALEERRRSSERASERGPSKKLVSAREGDRERNMESRYNSNGKASEAAVKTIEAHFVNADAALQVVCYPFVLLFCMFSNAIHQCAALMQVHPWAIFCLQDRRYLFFCFCSLYYFCFLPRSFP